MRYDLFERRQSVRDGKFYKGGYVFNVEFIHETTLIGFHCFYG